MQIKTDKQNITFDTRGMTMHLHKCILILGVGRKSTSFTSFSQLYKQDCKGMENIKVSSLCYLLYTWENKTRSYEYAAFYYYNLSLSLGYLNELICEKQHEKLNKDEFYLQVTMELQEDFPSSKQQKNYENFFFSEKCLAR